MQHAPGPARQGQTNKQQIGGNSAWQQTREKKSKWAETKMAPLQNKERHYACAVHNGDADDDNSANRRMSLENALRKKTSWSQKRK